MGAEAVRAAIARLDATSRTRALTPGETIQLSKLISTERRYAYMKNANRRAAAARLGEAGAPVPSATGD